MHRCGYLCPALQIRPQVPSVTLLAADLELNTAAIAEGLTVDDPNIHSQLNASPTTVLWAGAEAEMALMR